MNTKIFYIVFSTFIISTFFVACANKKQTFSTKGEVTQTAKNAERTYSLLAQDLLNAIKRKKSTDAIVDKLAKADREKLNNELDSDAKKMAFWVNIYNAYIMVTLYKNPKLYDDRGSFFKKEQITIAGHTMSFDKIEHGIIRSSTKKLSKGYLPKMFPGSFEKEFRLSNRDGRIHFVLNCGAKDCPPVYIYDAKTLNKDFDKVASNFLHRITEIDNNEKTIKTTPLFQWFTGDFGVGKKGVKNMLEKYNVISEANKDYKIKYKGYDWTLDLGNFGEEILSKK